MSDDPENPRDPREVAEGRTTWGRGAATPDELDEADALSIVPQVAANLYALGVVLYEMRTGALPVRWRDARAAAFVLVARKAGALAK